MKLFEILDHCQKIDKICDFPQVVVDQSNFRVGDIIRRNLAGEQVLGQNNLQYDFNPDKPDFDKLNPFNDMGFNLDDVIMLAHRNGQQVTDLQNRLGELKQELDQSKQTDKEKTPTSGDQPSE